MAERIPQSTTFRVPLKVYLSSDHVSDATGKTVAVVISKNGAAFGNPNAGATNATEIGNGWYYVDMDTTDTGTLGPLLIRGTSASCDNTEAQPYTVVKATNHGFTAIPDTACTTNASLLTSGTGTDQISVSAGKLLLQATQAGVTIPTVTTVTNQLTAAAIATGVWTDTTASDFTTGLSIGKSIMNGVTLGTGLKIAECVLADTLTTYTGNTPQTGDAYARLGAPVGASHSADVAAVKSDTGTILTDVNTGAGAIYTRIGAPAGVSIAADIAAVNAKTTNIPASPAAASDIPTANANADALLDRAAGVETGHTVRQAMRLMLASLAGKLSGAATTTVTIRDLGDTKDRIVATVDADGNRTAIVLDQT